MPSFTDIVELLKQGSKPLVAISLSSFFILLAPDPILDFFGGTGVVNEYRWIVGLVFLFSTALLLVDLVTKNYEYCRDRRKKKQRMERRIDRLHSLTPAERDTLRHFVSHTTRTGSFRRNDGVALGLEQEDILHRVSNFPDGIGFPFNIAPWAYEYLLDHPELVEKIEAGPIIYDSRAQS